ncbi:MAG: hypothetical protein ACSHUF_00120 [Candidatus Nasuia deltocephalinicola]
MFLKIFYIIGIESHYNFFSKKIFNFFNFYDFKNFNNNRVSYFDMGLAGIFPKFNLIFLNKIINFGFYLKNYLFYISFFIRKSYFYPDIPKNYQISKYISIFNSGILLIYNNYFEKPYYKFIKIIKIHMEEDTATTFYDIENNFSFLNFNRSNNFLLEVVSYFNLNNFYESYIYLSNINYFIFFLKKEFIETKNFRFDVNISLKYLYYDFLKYKIEIKNLNSFFILKCVIDFELKRQTFNLFFSKFFSETRFFNLRDKETYFIRFKKNAFSYKYIFELENNYIYFNNYLFLFLKKNIILLYYLKIYFFYNFKIFLNFNFFIFEFFIYIIKNKKIKKFFNFINYFLLFLKKKKISIFQILIIFKLFFYNLLSFYEIKKIFLILVYKKIFKILFIYKLTLKNFLILDLNLLILINFILFKNLKYVHSFIYNKKIFNFFIGKFNNFKINLSHFYNILNLKIFRLEKWVSGLNHVFRKYI